MAITMDDVLEGVDTFPGWLKPAEKVLLFNTALRRAKQHNEGAWVELGSYCGKSTVLIAYALKVAKAGELHAIDPHEGCLSYPSTVSAEGLMDGDGRTTSFTTLDSLKANLALYRVSQHVNIIVARSTDVTWDRPISFLFIDALHDYDNVRTDYVFYRNWLVDGAIVIFHDYEDWEGVTRLVNEKIAEGDLTVVEQAQSMLVTIFNKEQI